MRKLTIDLLPGDSIHDIAAMIREDAELVYDGPEVELAFVDRGSFRESDDKSSHKEVHLSAEATGAEYVEVAVDGRENEPRQHPPSVPHRRNAR